MATVKLVATHSYKSNEEGDLCFQLGDIISLISKDEDGSGWWFGELNGKRGMFPSTFVQFADPSLFVSKKGGTNGTNVVPGKDENESEEEESFDGKIKRITSEREQAEMELDKHLKRVELTLSASPTMETSIPEKNKLPNPHHSPHRKPDNVNPLKTSATLPRRKAVPDHSYSSSALESPRKPPSNKKDDRPHRAPKKRTPSPPKSSPPNKLPKPPEGFIIPPPLTTPLPNTTIPHDKLPPLEQPVSSFKPVPSAPKTLPVISRSGNKAVSKGRHKILFVGKKGGKRMPIAKGKRGKGSVRSLKKFPPLKGKGVGRMKKPSIKKKMGGNERNRMPGARKKKTLKRPPGKKLPKKILKQPA